MSDYANKPKATGNISRMDIRINKHTLITKARLPMLNC